MIESVAQSWFSEHRGVIPAFDVHKQEAIATIGNPRKNLADLAAVIALDPGMSISLYRQANATLMDRNEPKAESVEDALAVLGSSAIVDLVNQHVTVSESLSNQALRRAYQQLMSRIYFLLALVEQFIGIQGIRRIDETRSAALLHNVGEIYACLFDYVAYQKYQANFHVLGADVNSAKPVFGFGFRELGRVICERMNLPPLVSESLENTLSEDRRVRVIQFAADISHQAEEGWYHPAMKATQEVGAHYLNQSTDGFENLVKQTAISAARACPFSDVMPAAARLIMLPEAIDVAEISAHRATHAIDTPVKQTSGTSLTADLNFLAQLKSLDGPPKLDRSQLISLLLDHLEKDLQMTRVVLLTMSADGVTLGTGDVRGVKPHSVLNNLFVRADENRMFRSLLTKPLGVWVAPTTFAQYEAFLPASFKNKVLSEDFFLMALFSGSAPLGLVFCDRAQAVSDLDKNSYIRFKSAMMLSSKALALIDRKSKNPG